MLAYGCAYLMEMVVFRSLVTFKISCDSFAGTNFGTLPVIEFVRGVYRIEVVVCTLLCCCFAGDDIRTLQERVRVCMCVQRAASRKVSCVVTHYSSRYSSVHLSTSECI